MEQHLHREINDLKTEFGKLGGMVEEAIGKALTALKTGDKKLAKEVRHGDDNIDLLEVEVEERMLKMFALYQPVARDLRFLVTGLKVNNELEHMGDLAQSIASKVKQVTPGDLEKTRMDIFEMGYLVQKMVSMCLDAFLTKDSQKARSVIVMDDQVDDSHRKNHAVVKAHIKDDSTTFRLADLALLSVSRSLERIGDMATSISEDVIYFVEAQIVRHRFEDLD